MNVALYRRAAGGGSYQGLWAMTERGAQQLTCRPRHLQIGPSGMHWDAAGNLHIAVDEWTAPLPQRLRGHIVLRPQVLPGRDFSLGDEGRHRWQPICPRGRIEVDFASPRLRWEGEAYLDSNQGERPLERDFSAWQWSRSTLSGQRSHVFYEILAADGGQQMLALGIDAQGRIEPLPLPPRQSLAPTGWGLPRSSRTGSGCELMATLESGPFYSRSLLRDPQTGSIAVHESLSLRRFDQAWVQAMLPFRMPRRARNAA